MRKWATDLTDSTDLHGLLLESIRANPSNPFDPWSIPQWLRDNALDASRICPIGDDQMSTLLIDHTAHY